MEFTKRDNTERKNTQKYFDKLPAHYKEATIKYDELYSSVAANINQDLKGRVLDIGSGGIINYDRSLCKRLILLDITKSNVKKEGNTYFVMGDCTSIGLTKESVDMVIMQSLIHHLAEKSHKKTLLNIEKSFKEGYRVLKPGGSMFILENCPSRIIERIEIILYPFLSLIYKIIKFPLVFAHSQKTLKDLLMKCGFKEVSIKKIQLQGNIPILGFDIPEKYVPMIISIIRAKKEHQGTLRK